MNTPQIAAIFAWPITACSPVAKDCMEGYARDNADRCQPIASDTGESAGVGNTPPTAPSISLYPEAPRAQAADLICSINTESIDVDGDAVDYRIVWTTNGTAAETDRGTTLAGDTVAAERLNEGDRWECIVTPNDGKVDGPFAKVSVMVDVGFVGWGEQSVQLSDADHTIVGEENGGCFGASMAPAGDLDHDGKMDLIVGDYWWNHPDEGIDAGKAYVFLGADLGAGGRIEAADAAWSFEAEHGRVEDDPDCTEAVDEFDRCGGDWVAHSVAGGRDGDGDGTVDLLVSAYKNDDGGYDRGKVAFFSGGNLGERGTRSIADADVQIYGEDEGDRMGHSVNWAGDVDGDGISELVTGSDRHSGVGSAAGRTYLVMSGKLASGEDLTFPDDADYMWDGETAADQSGKRNVHVGDIDGDGLADIATSSIKHQANGVGPEPMGERRGSGKFYILLSGDINAEPRGSLMSVADATLAWHGEVAGDAMGYGIDLVGDFDGDGLGDELASFVLADVLEKASQR